MRNLTDWFGQVFIINCAHRPDRLARLKTHLKETGMADVDRLIVHPAIIGDLVTCPADWCSGNGPWGCLRSHSRLLEDVLHRRDSRFDMIWQSYLVLEDDVFFLPGALEALNRFMTAVPDDWDQIYLGGQHRRPFETTDSPEVIVGRSINRTHAYALSEKNYTRFYRHICYATDYRGNNHHIDHQLEIAHQRRDWTVYCPPQWICGQAAGKSNISGKLEPEQIWQP